MSSQSKLEIIFINQPTSYRPRGKNILLNARHGHIKGTGKTKFPIIQIKNVCGKLFLVVEPVYAGNETLPHHYRLVRYDQLKKKLPLTTIMDPLFYKLDGTKKDYTIKLKYGVMPPQDEYKRKGVDKKMMKKFDLNDKKMVLSCKVYLSYEDFKNGENAIATKYSNPLENLSQRLKDHKFVGEGSVDGGTEIKLPFLRDLPDTSYEVKFSNKREKFIAYGKIIKTCSQWMYVKTPPYILENTAEPVRLTEIVKISVHIVRVHDCKLSKEFHFQYTPSEIETPNFRSAGTSQDKSTTIMDMISMQKDDKMSIWLACSEISIPEECVIAEEYVKTNITVRFSEKNNEYTDIQIKEYKPTGLLILETPLNFYEKFGKDATIQINNTLCNTLSEKFKMKFPELKVPNQQEQSAQYQQITYSEPNISPDNYWEILKDFIDECSPSELANPDFQMFVKLWAKATILTRLNGIILCVNLLRDKCLERC